KLKETRRRFKLNSNPRAPSCRQRWPITHVSTTPGQTMLGILPDNNVVGQVETLVHFLNSPPWQEVWLSLNLQVLTFEDLGLPRDVRDSILWQVCQERHVLLITRNRNAGGPDSLEAIIRALNTPAHLPVFTLANADRIRKNQPYAELVVERLLEYLLDIENF